MKIGEVLKRIPGVTKRFLYYLEAKGYIQPQQVPKARLSRRDYSEADVRLIRRVFGLYHKGYTPRVAIQIAKSSEQADPQLQITLSLSPERQLSEVPYEHLGKALDEYIPIVPGTHMLVTAERLEDDGRFILHISIHVDGEEGPYEVAFVSHGSLMRKFETDKDGNAAVEVSAEDIDVLCHCSTFNVTKEAAEVNGREVNTTGLDITGKSAGTENNGI